MHPTRSLALAASLLALAGCSGARTVPEGERHALTRSWEGKILFLRASLNVMPFFTDSTKRLVSPWPADSVLLLEDTKGAPILPGEPEGLLALGTKVRIEKVEFPTGLAVTRRPLYTPRESIWVYLSLPGTPKGRPYVAVLRPRLSTREDFLAAMNDLFSEDEPSIWMKGASAETRAAIAEKRLVAGMDPEAVALAWGRPEKIRQEAEAGVRVETWTWPLGKRTATFRDGKLTAATPALEGPR